MMAALYVMPRDRRSTSLIAASSLSYAHMRQPPSAGPNDVLCTEMIAFSPDCASWKKETCSCWSNSLWLKTDMERSPCVCWATDALPVIPILTFRYFLSTKRRYRKCDRRKVAMLHCAFVLKYQLLHCVLILNFCALQHGFCCRRG